MRRLLPIALAALVLGCGGAAPSETPVATATPAASAPSPTPAPSPTAAPSVDASGALDALIDVGDGRRVHVLCRGASKPGVPTLWLEAGLDGSIHNWASVSRPLQQVTRVCAWDRANLGESDRDPRTERTVDDLVDDLEAAIDGAGVDGPIVIAAHSLGPWVSTVYTARHPDRVVGLVLIDPRGPHVSSEHLAALGQPTDGEPEVVTDVRDFMAEHGFDDNAEHVVFAPSEATVGGLLNADGPFFGDRPVVVLSAEGTIDQLPALPEPYLGRWWDIWTADQQRYADESTAGSVVVVPGSGHLIMDDRPRAVIDAVTEVLAATTT